MSTPSVHDLYEAWQRASCEEEAWILTRDWLIQGGQISVLIDGYPLWWWPLSQHWGLVVNELLCSGSDVNQRNILGQGWLHACIEYQVPVWLALEGEKKLSKTWWYPDALNQFPLNLQGLPGFMMVLHRRWEAERDIPWDEFNQKHFSERLDKS